MSNDGHIGHVTDLLIDDELWTVRYLVIDLKDALPARRVLIAPAAIEYFDSQQSVIPAILSSQQVLESPPLNWNQPLSRQYEEALVEYYRWPIYWLGRAVQKPAQELDNQADNSSTDFVNEGGSSNLRSAEEMCGYTIKTNNGFAGLMKDILIQMDAWTVDYATADANSRLPNDRSVFSTSHICSIDWSNGEIFVDLSKPVLQPKGMSANTPAITGKPLSSQPFPTA